MARGRYSYQRSVFINCPFDTDFKPVLDAIIFAVHDCGFQARIALEDSGSGQLRLERIISLISQSQYAICDLSRIDEPRLNMAFETGLIFGAKYFGSQRQRARDLLVLDERAHQFNRTLSDLRGIDGEGHLRNPAKAIGVVRKFLARKSGDPRIPGEAFIIHRFKQFQRDLTRMTASADAKYKARELESLSYLADWMNLMVEWLKADKSPMTLQGRKPRRLSTKQVRRH